MKFTMKYAATDCPTIDQIYGNSGDIYLRNAFLEFKNNEAFEKVRKDDDFDLPAIGTQQCFCDRENA